jgi:hypothetical protein
MLLLVQYISPLGMISALFISLIWTVPAAILVLRLLGGILLVSAPSPADATRSLLALTALRMPDWAVALAAILAAFTWQLRLLPALMMLIVAIMGVTAVQRRRPGQEIVLNVATLGVPIGLGFLVLLWMWPGIRQAWSAGEVTTAFLLAVPPILGPLLAGPVPARAARLATHWPAVIAALVAPFVVGIVFLRAPVLPNSAVEVVDGQGHVSVVRGQLITVDDVSTTMLRSDGEVAFLPDNQVRSETLCPQPVRPPESVVVVRGWAVEDSALEWVAPTRRIADVDPRCLGRPVDR